MVLNAFEPDQMPNDIGSDHLRSALADHTKPLRARLALKILAQRFPNIAAKEARSVLEDRLAPEEIRSTAAVELGRHCDAAGEDVLLDVLSDGNHAVLKHVIRSIGQIGHDRALARLESLRLPSGDGPASTALSFAKALISYRIGSHAHILKAEQGQLQRIPLTPERIGLQFGDIAASDFERALPSIRRQLPAVPVTRKGGVAFVCGNSMHWILMHEEVAQPAGVDVVQRRPMIIGAILKYRACSNSYSLDEYLVTNGGAQGLIILLGVRPSGIVVHAGAVALNGQTATFELQACNPPYSRPIDLHGVFQPDDGRLSFSRALTGTWNGQRALASVPARRVHG